MEPIEKNIELVRQRIATAEQRSARRPHSVLLLAASKSRDPGQVRRAARAGLQHFGESHVQEAAPKIQALGDAGIVWHFIGPVQSNKTREIASTFAWVHSVDRLKIARRLNEQRPDDAPPLNVCIQVNLAAEPTKSGVGAEELPGLATAIASLDRLKLRGLMAIPPKSPDTQTQRAGFAAVRAEFESLRRQGFKLDTLSMGMSGDLEAAIAEGATIVRIGSAIFGPRGP